MVGRIFRNGRVVGTWSAGYGWSGRNMVSRIFRNAHDVGKWLVGTGNRNMRVVVYGWQDIQERASVRNRVGRIFRKERVVRTWSAGYSGTGKS
jgi:hypothetical protein